MRPQLAGVTFVQGVQDGWTVFLSPLRFVTELGADEVFEYQQVDFTKAIDDVDVVLDTVGGD